MGNGFTRVFVFVAAVVAAGVTASAQQSPADQSANRAYDALRAKDYDRAIADFQQAIALAPQLANIRLDLAYTLLKAGETEAARDQFAEALRLDPKDDQVALEYAYLCYETREPAIARRVFERLKKSGNPAAAAAFENVDRPLREGIARWEEALAVAPGNFSAHEELARLAAEGDDSALAAEHYESAWRLKTDRRDLLLELGRAWKALDREEDANAAWIAAWRGGTPRVSEEARALLPGRYPYLSEFQRALALDPGNLPLQRDVAYQRGDPPPPSPAPPAFEARPEEARAPGDAKTLGMRSLDKGFLADALKYLQLAHEADSNDYEVMLKLGWTFNMLKDDETALHWFDLARRSPDPDVAAQATKAYRGLAPSYERFRTTVWVFPIYSSRWQDLFGYACGARPKCASGTCPSCGRTLRFDPSADVRGAVNAGFGPQSIYPSAASSLPLVWRPSPGAASPAGSKRARR